MHRVEEKLIFKLTRYEPTVMSKLIGFVKYNVYPFLFILAFSICVNIIIGTL